VGRGQVRGGGHHGPAQQEVAGPGRVRPGQRRIRLLPARPAAGLPEEHARGAGMEFLNGIFSRGFWA
jgi:hypothetical protein